VPSDAAGQSIQGRHRRVLSRQESVCDERNSTRRGEGAALGHGGQDIGWGGCTILGEMKDTEARAQERWMEIIRQMTPAQRPARTWELSEAVRQMFLANLQHLDEQSQRRRLAEACYGPEAVELMYGK
jgi:hypothetical protein